MLQLSNMICEDHQFVREMLMDADAVPLAMVLVHLTGESDILEEICPYIRGPWSYQETIPPTLRLSIIEQIEQKIYSDSLSQQKNISIGILQRMLSVAAGESIPTEYLPLVLEELNLAEEHSRLVKWNDTPDELRLRKYKVILIGAGISGLCMAVQLRSLGVSFLILEKNSELGGTWYENQYPGCGVDTPNHFYSYSFFSNHEWTRYYSGRDEILAYLKKVANSFDLNEHIKLSHEVESARFDEASSKWVVHTNTSGRTDRFVADMLISCVGQLNRPALPNIPGLDEFPGPKFHTAAWDHSVDLKGASVAMIGNGASGMQAGPSIAPIVDCLNVIQRTPHWARPVPDYHRFVSCGTKWAIRNLPYFDGWMRFRLFWGTSDGFYDTLQIDPAWKETKLSVNAVNEKLRRDLLIYMEEELAGNTTLLEMVTPNYPPFGKRMLRDNNWYRMLIRNNVNLFSGSVEKIENGTIITSSTDQIKADVLLFATGFQARRMLWPMDIVGRDNLSIRDVWGDDDPRAFLGMAVPGFPNLFVMYGPNTSLVHGGSIIFHAECQSRYIAQVIREAIETNWLDIECRPEVHDAYNRRLDEKFSGLVWSHSGVNSWYKNNDGRITAASPWKLIEYWKMTYTFDRSDYLIRR